MLWVMSVLLLSVMIECKNKTEEEKPTVSEPTLVQDNTTISDNSTTNVTSQGNLGKAKNLRKGIIASGTKPKRTEAPKGRFERPKRVDTEAPKGRLESLMEIQSFSVM